MGKGIRKLLAADQGATAVEYGLLVSLIFIAAVGAIQAFGNNAIAMWTYVQSSM